jgi:hypothetical protein
VKRKRLFTTEAQRTQRKTKRREKERRERKRGMAWTSGTR